MIRNDGAGTNRNVRHREPTDVQSTRRDPTEVVWKSGRATATMKMHAPTTSATRENAATRGNHATTETRVRRIHANGGLVRVRMWRGIAMTEMHAPTIVAMPSGDGACTNSGLDGVLDPSSLQGRTETETETSRSCGSVSSGVSLPRATRMTGS